MRKAYIFLFFTALIVLNACSQNTTPNDKNPIDNDALGVLTVEISGVGSEIISSSANFAPSLSTQALKEDASFSRDSFEVDNVETFVTGGKRYVNALYTFTNNNTLREIVMVAMDTDNDGSAISDVERYDGSPVTADVGLALGTAVSYDYPFGGVITNPADGYTTLDPDTITLDQGTTATVLSEGFRAYDGTTGDPVIRANEVGRVLFSSSFDESTVAVTEQPFAFKLTFIVAEDNVKEVAEPLVGRVWLDYNDDGVQTEGEPSLADQTVFLDDNANGILDEGETSTLTDANGDYTFANLILGESYNINTVLKLGQSYKPIDPIQPLSTTATYNSSTHRAKVTDADRIVGGIDAVITDFPFMLALGGDGEDSFRRFCGATLISSRFAVTAAHCVEEGNSGNPGLQVMLGSAELDNPNRTVIGVSNIIVHPEYVDAPQGFDVAILELAERVFLDDFNYTVGLVDDTMTALTATDTIATATGWGTLASGGASPNVLQSVHTKIADPASCEQAYLENDSNLANFETQICAGVPEGGVDGCQGDSGGPLFVRGTVDGQEQWLHAGATSWGRGCALEGFPGIWSRTSALYDWIAANASERSNGDSFDTINPVDVNFGIQLTTRPFITEVAPRWQVTTFGITNDVVEANAPIDFAWNVFMEEGASEECNLEIDSGAASELTPVPCVTGANTYQITEGLGEGSYLITLDHPSTGVKRTIQLDILGPPTSTVTGELTADDAVDPDYGSTYYIDYFDLDTSGLDVGERFLVKLTEDGFSPYLVVYNKDERVANGEGGAIAQGGNEQTITIESGVTYLIGVTTAGVEEVGGYRLDTYGGVLSPSDF